MQVAFPAKAMVAADTLSAGQAGVLLAVMIGGSLVAGIIIVVARSRQQAAGGESQSIVRSWLAITLVLGLLTTSAAAFELDDPQLRNTLLGGLVASVGAATAFYFSSKGADAARADILKATTVLAQGGVAPSAFSAYGPPTATVGTAYSYVFAADGSPPVGYTVGSGTLPAGLQLDPNGRLHGTPEAAGSATFTVVATNAFGSVTSPTVMLEVEATQ
jgi:Putative Ig domain